MEKQMKAESGRGSAMPLIGSADGGRGPGGRKMHSPLEPLKGAGLQFQLKTTQIHSLRVLESKSPKGVSGG